MKIVFENPDKVNGLITLTVEEEDYKNEVEKTLKDYRRKANVPGFRPGQVPMGLIKRQFGTSVKVDVINKKLGEQIYNYVNENKIKMLGEPLPSDQQAAVDIEKEAPYVFKFDVAVAPEFTAELFRYIGCISTEITDRCLCLPAAFPDKPDRTCEMHQCHDRFDAVRLAAPDDTAVVFDLFFVETSLFRFNTGPFNGKTIGIQAGIRKEPDILFITVVMITGSPALLRKGGMRHLFLCPVVTVNIASFDLMCCCCCADHKSPRK